jgi:hypothetical protein
MTDLRITTHLVEKLSCLYTIEVAEEARWTSLSPVGRA